MVGERNVGGVNADPKEVTAEVRQAARTIVGNDWFRDSQADRLAYANDCWPLGILWTRGGKIGRHCPDFVVMPGSRDEIQRLIELARDSGTPVIPYGAGSGVCGGTLAVRGGFTIDVKRLNEMRWLDREALLVRAQAGAIGMHLETDLNRRGYTLGHFPSSLYCSSLGGYLAGRSAGQFSSRFGKIEDMCFSLEMVAGTGEVMETSRYQPDLTQLAMGSEGTLGVITEGTLRIEPWAAERTYRGFRFHSVEAGLDAIRTIIQAGYRPAVVRLYDSFDSLLARRHKTPEHGESLTPEPEADVEPEGLLHRLIEHAKGLAPQTVRSTLRRAAVGLMQRVLGSPLLLNRAVSALPVGCLLVIGFEGPAGLTNAEAEDCFEVLRDRADDLGEGPGQHWFQNRFAVSYKQSPLMDMGAFVDTMEVSTSWDNIHNLYRNVKQAVSRSAFIMAHFSHVYPAGSSIYFTFAGFAPDGEPIEALYQRTWSEALGAVRKSQASIAHHHGVGLAKAPYLSHDHQGGQPLVALLKQRLDPAGIMNPGKLWDARQLPESEAL